MFNGLSQIFKTTPTIGSLELQQTHSVIMISACRQLLSKMTYRYCGM
jgi:hypothetical protein